MTPEAWAIRCAEMWAENVRGLDDESVCAAVKECSNRIVMDEDYWFALQDAMTVADLEAKKQGKIRGKVWNSFKDRWE